MAKSRREDHPDLLGEPPDEVWVTFMPGPRGPSLRERLTDLRIPANVLGLIGAAVVAAAILAFVLTAPFGGGGTAGSTRGQPGGIGGPRAWVAYRNSPRCSGAAIKPHHRRITLAEFDRIVWCERSIAHPNSSIDQFVSAP
jgi:hypothetical protein